MTETRLGIKANCQVVKEGKTNLSVGGMPYAVTLSSLNHLCLIGTKQINYKFTLTL